MKTLIAIVIAASATGCAMSTEYREVIIHKDSDGKIIGTDYKETLKQSELLFWKGGFGKYLFNQ